jgi:hypothetical protein
LEGQAAGLTDDRLQCDVIAVESFAIVPKVEKSGVTEGTTWTGRGVRNREMEVANAVELTILQ